jgi:hypothetical protein
MSVTEDSVHIARLEERMKHLETDVSNIRSDIAEVLSTLSEAKGGWRTLMLLGGCASSFGAFAYWLISKFPWSS